MHNQLDTLSVCSPVLSPERLENCKYHAPSIHCAKIERLAAGCKAFKQTHRSHKAKASDHPARKPDRHAAATSYGTSRLSYRAIFNAWGDSEASEAQQTVLLAMAGTQHSAEPTNEIHSDGV